MIRVFWAVLGVIMVATVAVVLFQGQSSAPALETTGATAHEHQPEQARVNSPRAGLDASASDRDSISPPPVSEQQSERTAPVAAAPELPLGLEPDPEVLEPFSTKSTTHMVTPNDVRTHWTPPTEPDPAPPEPAMTLSDMGPEQLRQIVREVLGDTAFPPDTDAASTTNDPTDEAIAAAEQSENGAFTPEPGEAIGPSVTDLGARAESQPDRFAFAGAGTKEDPFKVSWSLLTSAQESFQPRLGLTEMPEHIKKLDGKYVRISGFVAFPFMVQESSELLMMQNQWDGCCLGVPPTAYDAIEVLLKAPAEPTQRFMQYGVVQGKLKVDPYVRGQWLISLYTMDDAELAPEM